MVAIAACRAPSDHLTIDEDRLATERIGVIGVNFDGDELVRDAGFLLTHQRVAADEAFLVEPDKAVHRGFQNGVLGVQIRAPKTIGFFQSHGVHGAHAHQCDVEFLARFHEGVIEVVLVFDRVVQFPSQRADEVDPQSPHAGGEANRNFLHGQPLEGIVGQVGVGEFRQHLARIGPGQDENPVLGGDVANENRSVGGNGFHEPVPVDVMGRAGSHHIEAFAEQAIAHSRNGIFGAHRSAGKERVTKHHPADRLGNVVGDHLVQPSPGAGALHFIFGEGGKLHQAGALPHGLDLLADRLEPVRPAVGHLILAFRAFGGEPVGTFPAEAHTPDSPGPVQALVAGGGFGRPTGRTLFHWIVVEEDMGVGFFVFQLGELLGGYAETPGIDAVHVDRGFALDHPLGKLPAGAAGRRHAEGVTFGNPEVLQAEGGPDHGVAVGGVGNRAVGDVLDAGVLEGGNPVDAGFDVRQKPVEVAGKEILFKALGDALDKAGRRAFFVGPQDPAVALLAQVVAGVGFAQHRQFGVAGLAVFLQHGIDVGDDELVLHRNGRNFQANLQRGLAGIVAGGANHVLTAHHALIGGDDPFVVVPLDGRDHGVLVNFRAQGAGALGQRHRDVDRRDVPVGGMPQRAHQAFGVDQRPELLDLFFRDHMRLDADGFSGALIEAVFIHPVSVGRQTKVAGAVEADGLPGFRFQALVELDRVLVELAHRIAHVEQRQQARGVPGGAGGQLGALQQDGVGPAFLGQMIERAYAINAAADDDDPCGSLHVQFPMASKKKNTATACGT